MAQATQDTPGPTAAAHSNSSADRPAAPRWQWRRWAIIAAVLLALGVAAWRLVPVAITAFTTISTDDAYVSGHVTLVAPRVSGQVVRVLVDDTQQVKAGTLLVELDKQPYQVQYNQKAAAVEVAKANVTAAEADARATEATARGRRWQLQSAIEQVGNQVATLRARVAALSSQQAAVTRARADLQRAEAARKRGVISQEEVDQRREASAVAEAQAREAEQKVYQARAALGLPEHPSAGAPLDQVPADIAQTFSGVRVALAQLVQSAAQLGLELPRSNETPKEYLDRFYHNPENLSIEQLLERIVNKAPPVIQARAKLEEARRDLEQARLNLSYCEVRAEIDGVVARRSVNPGNNVQSGQQLMAVRSLSEVWVDANFKETQLADIRIGQPVDLYVDTYGKRLKLVGRVAGFSPGTGSTLALLPPENATGNFVKVVQRLPVRIELTEPPSEDTPLFAGPVGYPLHSLPGGADRPRGWAEAPDGPARHPRARTDAGGPAAESGSPSRDTHSTPARPRHGRPVEQSDWGPAVSAAPLRQPAETARGWSRRRSPCPRSWRCSIPASPTSRCGTSPAGFRPPRPMPSGSSLAIWPPTPSSCRSPAGSPPSSAGGTTSCSALRCSLPHRWPAAWPPASPS